MVLLVSCSSSCGLASTFGTPNSVREGPAARMSTLFGTLPCTMKPAIITLAPVPTCSRVEMFPSVAGLGVGVGVGAAVGVAVTVAVGVAVAVAVGVAATVAVAVAVWEGVGVGATVAVGVAVAAAAKVTVRLSAIKTGP